VIPPDAQTVDGERASSEVVEVKAVTLDTFRSRKLSLIS
jgi:hypothetical protein